MHRADQINYYFFSHFHWSDSTVMFSIVYFHSGVISVYNNMTVSGCRLTWTARPVTSPYIMFRNRWHEAPRAYYIDSLLIVIYFISFRFYPSSRPAKTVPGLTRNHARDRRRSAISFCPRGHKPFRCAEAYTEIRMFGTIPGYYIKYVKLTFRI